ncbi:tRNA (adenosine(37)-N6)-threonylcarbamoyltransferase complex ATPase subunit type 1 TsaE [Porphyromonas gingivalis]|uniref:tRNA (adenosine(37)-N6)-threonylcarbamoyltransferase complex ATPase subunit type 1 TsaE n=1 Tax=Porphyromonas gingivalis TaxID=837 RepID=UPI0006BADCD7|nr:tRNA (adenosine(37)-N6)-threonylcarbamoyltransferase complex ATPase subunit type 1 TsaE [Porphyromonas gingivalis]PDP65658.1 tRNA (adenosine(37)-N6)-threonylcarbamoyltransferase complex ATPase subunit type 1 TsaE [Porphyromonas gingivalis]GAP80560.1 ATP/GTP hydrolase [Porphyromonas gingivalis]
MNTITIDSTSDLGRAARDFIVLMGDNTVFAFYAPMGTGKTTFIKAVCEELGVSDVINSPTFSIINEYRSDQTGELIYHFDCYRLNKIEDALNLGVEDYFDSGSLCFIEWPELLEPILPNDTVHVRIEELEDGKRRLTF